MQKQPTGPSERLIPNVKPKTPAKAMRAPGLTLRRKLEGPKRRAY